MPTRYEVLPIPPIMTHTKLFPAGPLQLGVEYRFLNEEVIEAEFGEDAREKFGKNVPEDMQSDVDEDGVSIHVFDQTAEREFLRFDCFADYPHYHYIENQVGHQVVHQYDDAAHGPMVEWVLDCLTHRLPDMLKKAGEEALSKQIDPRSIEKILPDVAAAIGRAQEAGRPLVAGQ